MRFKRAIVSLAATAALTGFAGLALAGEVFQGTAISFDAGANKLVLKNSEPDKNKVPKTMTEVTFDTSTAKIGLAPAAGDKIRVAYDQKGDKLMAVKVMNVTKQDLRKK